MGALLNITKEMLSRYTSIFLVLLAFALMVFSSYVFVSRTENRNLRRNAENAMLFTEANIKADMQGLQTLLGVASETIGNMIINGDDSRDVNQYIAFINNYVETGRGNGLYGATGIFGIFDIFNGQMLIGSDSWDPPDGYSQRSRPWYTGAIIASGEISITEPYLNEFSQKTTITLSRRIFDQNRIALGIICLNIELDRIVQYVVNTQFVEGGYGFLLSENMMIIAHPDPAMVGIPFRDVKSSGIAAMANEFEYKDSVSEIITHDYRGIQTIAFFQQLQNGWYMGVVTPRDRYFQSTRNLALALSAFGVIFAVLLIGMLLSISAEKAKSDERMKLMFNSIPLVAYVLNNDYNVIDCNQNAVTLFDLSSKQEFNDGYYDLLPEYQPDGRLTSEIVSNINKKIYEEGSGRFELTYQKYNGELVPCEITCTSVIFKNDFTVVGYMRDMREQKKMLEEIQQRARLLNTVNSAAAVLLSNNEGETFETSLMKSFELVGRSLDVDRVQIWLNEMIDGDLHFVLRYEWLSEYGKICAPISNGIHFPYKLKQEWESKFLRGENINAPLRELPEEDSAFLGAYGMKSIVILPMFLESAFWGFFSIDDCRNERTLSDEEISILSSAGLMMTSAVNRNIQALNMREADERTQLMFDVAPLGIFFWDKNFNIIDCNQEAVNLFELSSKQEFIEKFIQLSPEYQPDGILSGEKGSKLVRKAMEEGYSRFEWVHQKLNGELIPVDITCIRIKLRDEFTVTEYIRDLREQKAMLAEMRKVEIAEEGSKAKSDFLARMSHEIRTPMNAILGIAEIQLQDETHPAVTREAFDRIYNSGGLLLGIINDILDLSKIEAGKLVLNPAQYDIASLIHDTIQLNIMRYETKPIKFVLNITEDIPLFMIGDELRIKQILNNLLSNAFKYTEEGTIKLSVYTELADPMDFSKIFLIFVISDTGQGMTPEQVQRLGTEYSRFNQEANRKTEGTGLGMNITNNLVHIMDGKISVESTSGVGSTFTVRLPQQRSSSDVIGKEMANNLMNLNIDNSIKIRALQLNREYMPYGRVLVVDDVETNLYVARGLIAPYGISVETAISGFEAIDKIKDGCTYDIIFMDHMMPKMDGIEAAKIIRDMGYLKPIVALTANALAGQAAIFTENGFDDFISKPIDIRQLNLTLNRLVRDKYPLDVIEAAKKQKEHLYSGTEQKKSLGNELREIFIRDAKKAITTMEAIYFNNFRKDDDLSAFIINIHAMKSALANIGETNLSADAAMLEKAGREKNINLILSELPSFMEMLRTLIKRFEDKEKTGKKTDDLGNNQYLKDKLQAVKDACVLLDKKIAKDTLAEIREKTWSQSVNEQLSAMSVHLLHSEFEEAVQVIDDCMWQL